MTKSIIIKDDINLLGMQTQSDVVLNDSDKLLFVPVDEEWRVLAVHARLISSATVGNRQLALEVRASNGELLHRSVAGATQAASLTRDYTFGPGVADLVAFRSATLTTPTPHMRLGPLFVVRVVDLAAIAPTTDDLEVQAVVERRRGSHVSVNLIRFSQELNSGFWTSVALGAVGVNAASAPDGTLTAELLQTDTANSIHFHRQSVAKVLVGLRYTASVHLKRVDDTTTQFAYLTVFDGGSGEFGGRVNLVTGVVDQLVQGGAAVREAFVADPVPGDGWFRVSTTGLMTSSSSVQVTVHVGDPAQGTYVTSYVGVPAFNRILVWGVQLEVGELLSPYKLTV